MSRYHISDLALSALETRTLLDASMTGATPVLPESTINVPVWMKYYGFNQVTFQTKGGTTVQGNGAGELVAIVMWNRDASYTNSNDPEWLNSGLARYSVAHNLPTSGFTFQMVNQSGNASPLPAPDDHNAEFDLDTQTIHTVAPHANIVVVVANSSDDTDIKDAIETAIKLKPAVLSMSFSGQEGTSGQGHFPDSLFKAGNGVTYVASAGDHGAGLQNVMNASGVGTTTEQFWMESPANKPMIVQVGGTTLKTNSSRAIVNEVVWGYKQNSRINGGSGGGYSRVYSRPAFQSASPSVQHYLQSYASAQIPVAYRNARLGPDVSLMSKPGLTTLRYSSTQGFYWYKNDGGTSLAAPMFAGLMAIADQGRKLAGKPSLESRSTLKLLYSAPSTVFRDVTQGNNGFPAEPGFDLASGLGAAKVVPLVNYLVAAPANSGIAQASIPGGIHALTSSKLFVTSHHHFLSI